MIKICTEKLCMKKSLLTHKLNEGLKFGSINKNKKNECENHNNYIYLMMFTNYLNVRKE